MDAAVITAFFTGLVLLIGAVVAAVVSLRKVGTALDVINGMSPGEQLDAATLARLRDTPHDERTPTEQKHLDRAGPPEEPQGPSPTVAERTEAIYNAVNGNPAGRPTLYEMVATLGIKLDVQDARLDRLESLVGGEVPPGDPDVATR